ncbi:MAG: hypothetical protein K0R18_405 [Bacillales bacterium]|jgi:hypothetical protein|nr:hypothetical protein [Bacillales bacterium]
MSRTDGLKLSPEERLEFQGQLETLCAKFGVILEADVYCDEPFLKITDEEGNWNSACMDPVTGKIDIHKNDMWEL